MTNSQWVTLLCCFARQSHQSCFILWPIASEWHCFSSLLCSLINHVIPWPTECEWNCFISLPHSLINHVSSHDQQNVSDMALCLCQAVSSIMSHPMTNSMWVTMLYFSARHSCWSCLIPWPTVSEWQGLISLPGSLIYHVMTSLDQQLVSETPLCLCQAV